MEGLGFYMWQTHNRMNQYEYTHIEETYDDSYASTPCKRKKARHPSLALTSHYLNSDGGRGRGLSTPTVRPEAPSPEALNVLSPILQFPNLQAAAPQPETPTTPHKTPGTHYPGLWTILSKKASMKVTLASDSDRAESLVLRVRGFKVLGLCRIIRVVDTIQSTLLELNP